MRENNVVLGILCTILSLLLFIVSFSIDLSKAEKNILSNKQFILDNATYKCIKTNELKEGE